MQSSNPLQAIFAHFFKLQLRKGVSNFKWRISMSLEFIPLPCKWTIENCERYTTQYFFFSSKACKFDFEDGIGGWVKTGTAFNNQPTYGDNPTARNRGQPTKQQGNWWIGGSEHRPTIETPAGQTQGDGPQGTLTMPPFNIIGQYITFLIGGGCDINVVRAELIVGNQVSVVLGPPLAIVCKWVLLDCNQYLRFCFLY